MTMREYHFYPDAPDTPVEISDSLQDVATYPVGTISYDPSLNSRFPWFIIRNVDGNKYWGNAHPTPTQKMWELLL